MTTPSNHPEPLPVDYRSFSEMFAGRMKVMGFHTDSQMKTRLGERSAISERNISNWRRGTNTPSPGFLPTLAKVLGVQGDALLEEQWNRLYAEAKRKAGDDPVLSQDIGNTAQNIASPAQRKRVGSVYLGAGLGFLTALVSATVALAIFHREGWVTIGAATASAPASGQESLPVVPEVPQSYERRAAAALDALSDDYTIRLGPPDAPVRVYLTSKLDCAWCEDFVNGILAAYARDGSLGDGRVALVLVPWWDGTGQGNISFDVHLAALCKPEDARWDWIGRYYAVAQMGDEAAGTSVRGMLNEDLVASPELAACFDDVERVRGLNRSTVDVSRIVGGLPGVAFVNGTPSYGSDESNIRFLIDRALSDLPASEP